ncbi:MAG: hypothetical protein M3264_07995, partial [Thermoproteota archaeon]|nr:hypothetical protein [Thermoproteota archaeon]
ALGWVGAAPAAAENITKQEIKTRVTKRLRLRIFTVPPARGDLSSVLALSRVSQKGLPQSRPKRNYSLKCPEGIVWKKWGKSVDLELPPKGKRV